MKDWAFVITEAGLAENLPVADAELDGLGICGRGKVGNWGCIGGGGLVVSCEGFASYNLSPLSKHIQTLDTLGNYQGVAYSFSIIKHGEGVDLD